MNKPTVTIIGYGRFGKTLNALLRDDFAVTIFQRKQKRGITTTQTKEKNLTITNDLQKAYQSTIIFYAVPIASFETVIKTHKKYFRDDHVLIDVLSVKLHAAKVLKKYLAHTKTQAILTHPMFGPDSSQKGFASLPIVINQFLATNEIYAFWKKYFLSKNLTVLELSPNEHDRLAANSHGMTHFIGRLLQDFGMKKTQIDTVGASKLLEVKEQTCNDTWELFTNLQHYNPYTKSMRLRLGESYDKLYNKLLPKRIQKGYLTIGIQGGKGSFNEEAILHYLKKNKITKYKIRYLYTSSNVIKHLHEGTIDQGLMATHNSIGGIVMETIEALAKQKCKIREEFSIKISHAMMIHPDAQFETITQVMAHPQGFAQCKHTLTTHYQHLKKTVGKGKLVDHAYVAQQLSKGKLPITTAVMGSKILADIYNLKIIAEDLQDAKQNDTSFLLIER
jgi:prephenate dehydrogenase